MILQPSERLTRKITIDRHTQNKINIIHKEQDRERFSAFPKPYGGACPRRTVFKYYSRVNYNLSANEPKAPSGRGLRRWRRWRRVRCNIISPSHYITRAPSTARRSPFLPEEGFLFVRICSIVTLNYNLFHQKLLFLRHGECERSRYVASFVIGDVSVLDEISVKFIAYKEEIAL